VTPTGPHIDPCHVAVYETLVVKGEDGAPQPGLAHSWAISQDGLEWRFELRPGARFHSGAPCDAQAALEALMHLRYTFPLGQLWYWDPVDEVVTGGADALVFRLHCPYPRLPSLLWGTHSTIYNEHARAADPDGFGYAGADGTGPFSLASWSEERVVAVRSAGYDGERARLEQLEWHSILDPGERVVALERGDVDVLHGPPFADAERLAADERFTLVEHPQASSVYLAPDWCRTDLGFDDVRVREAISLAVDRDAIVREVFAGRGHATWGPVPPGDAFYDATVDQGRKAEPERARELLRAARGDESIRCECVAQDDPFIRAIASMVVEQLARVVVELELRFARPFGPFYEEVAAGPACFLSKWLWQDAIDAVIGFASTRCKGFPNWQHASIPSLDAAFDDWLRAQTQAELQAAASAVQQSASTELPYIPLVTPNDIWVHVRQLRGFRPYQADLYPRYRQAHLE
jgi:ABC-type transport system substrate-binding protein